MINTSVPPTELARHLPAYSSLATSHALFRFHLSSAGNSALHRALLLAVSILYAASLKSLDPTTKRCVHSSSPKPTFANFRTLNGIKSSSSRSLLATNSRLLFLAPATMRFAPLLSAALSYLQFHRGVLGAAAPGTPLTERQSSGRSTPLLTGESDIRLGWSFFI